MGLSANTFVLADVGGTNTRVGVVRDGVPADVQHFKNAAFPNLYAVLGAYVEAASLQQVDGCCVAMAGPVRGGLGRLTNCDWQISAAELGSQLGCTTAVLLNDLTAMGYAVSSLPNQSLFMLEPPQNAVPNGQSLVVGIGTGFNVCPVLRSTDENVQCLQVEMGHAALPAPLKDALVTQIGKEATGFATLEHLFAGEGLARFHQVFRGGELSARGIVQAHEAGDPKAGETLEVYTKLLGILCNELAYQYMPMNGIWFAGSVARGVLRPEFRTNLATGDASGGKIGNFIGSIPKAIILDDAAALRGCLAALDLVEPR